MAADAGRRGVDPPVRLPVPSRPVSDHQQIGFRFDAVIAGEVKHLARLAKSKSRAALVREAIVRGLDLVAQDPTPTISPQGAAAGPHQSAVRLTAEQASRLDDLRGRTTSASGRPVQRVYLLRECLWRGLQEMRNARSASGRGGTTS